MNDIRLYQNSWNGNTPIMCCHIPKAMGSWLRKELMHSIGPERNFKPVATFIGKKEFDDPVWLDVLNSKDKYSLVEGHFVFDDRARTLAETHLSISCVRDPFEMFWSHVKYIIQTRGSTDHLALFTKNEKYRFDNPMCRYFSGIREERLLMKNELDYYFQIAKENIARSFDFIFIDKYLQASCDFFLQYSNGVKINPSMRVNQSKSSIWHLDFDLFRSACFYKYKKYYEYDYKLYNYIIKQFISKAGEHHDKLLPGLS